MNDPELLGGIASNSQVEAYRRGCFETLTLAEQVVFLDAVEATALFDDGVGTGLSIVLRGLMMVDVPLPGLVPYQ